MARHILITGATGLVGGAVLARLLEAEGDVHAWVLVRDPARWPLAAARLRLPGGRITPVRGDLTRPGLGLAADARARLTRRLDGVVHAAADTCFSRSLADARATNRDGTLRVLELAERARVDRFAFVSTAFVAGRRTGVIPEAADPGSAGWVNAYERSKHEAETHVRASALPWVILRSSTIVCDDEGGHATQLNAVHRALLLFQAGLASLLPGSEDTPVDLVPGDYVADAVARLALDPDAERRTFHLCAGRGALPLGEMLDRCRAHWERDPAWRGRAVARPALTDLPTYRLFERAVEETADARLRRITRSLSHFVPQLALPKRFDTAHADAALGHRAPPVRRYWERVLDGLAGRAAVRRAA